jgi:hypothetical protein
MSSPTTLQLYIGPNEKFKMFIIDIGNMCDSATRRVDTR